MESCYVNNSEKINLSKVYFGVLNVYPKYQLISLKRDKHNQIYDFELKIDTHTQKNQHGSRKISI